MGVVAATALFLTLTAAPGSAAGAECAPVQAAFKAVLHVPFVRITKSSAIGEDAPRRESLRELAGPDREHLTQLNTGLEFIRIGDERFVRPAAGQAWRRPSKVVGLPGVSGVPFAEYQSAGLRCTREADAKGTAFLVQGDAGEGLTQETRVQISAQGLPTAITWDELLNTTGVVRHHRQDFEYTSGTIDAPIP